LSSKNEKKALNILKLKDMQKYFVNFCKAIR